MIYGSARYDFFVIEAVSAVTLKDRSDHARLQFLPYEIPWARNAGQQ